MKGQARRYGVMVYDTSSGWDVVADARDPDRLTPPGLAAAGLPQ